MSAYPPIIMVGLGTSNPVNTAVGLDTNHDYSSFNLGLIATVSPGAVLTYKVQVTGDVLPTPNSPNWNDHDQMKNLTGSFNGNVAYPVTGVRLVITAYTSGFVNLGVTKWP
jgi:hypothetical protein